MLPRLPVAARIGVRQQAAANGFPACPNPVSASACAQDTSRSSQVKTVTLVPLATGTCTKPGDRFTLCLPMSLHAPTPPQLAPRGTQNTAGTKTLLTFQAKDLKTI